MLAMAQQAFAHQKVIIGHDARLPIKSSPARMQKLGEAVGLMFSPIYKTVNSKGLIDLDFRSLGESLELCPGQRFANQASAEINCTGFLVAPDLLVTAGHCMINTGSADNALTPFCSNFEWYFGFDQNKTQDLSPEDFYSCETVISVRHETTMRSRGVIESFGEDYALIKLDRPVKNRTPLKLAQGDVRRGEPLTMIGHPSGIPKTLSAIGKVESNEQELFFEASLDSFGGNSGSPVFNRQQEVVGVLVRGPEDYSWDNRLNCRRAIKCSFTGRGCESPVDIFLPQVNRLDQIRDLLK